MFISKMPRVTFKSLFDFFVIRHSHVPGLNYCNLVISCPSKAAINHLPHLLDFKFIANFSLGALVANRWPMQLGCVLKPQGKLLFAYKNIFFCLKNLVPHSPSVLSLTDTASLNSSTVVCFTSLSPCGLVWSHDVIM